MLRLFTSTLWGNILEWSVMEDKCLLLVGLVFFYFGIISVWACLIGSLSSLVGSGVVKSSGTRGRLLAFKFGLSKEACMVKWVMWSLGAPDLQPLPKSYICFSYLKICISLLKEVTTTVKQNSGTLQNRDPNLALPLTGYGTWA